MEADKIRLVFTYLLATLVLVGCFTLLMIPSQIDPKEILPFDTLILGYVLAWLFGKEQTAAAQRSTERAVALGQQGTTTPPAP